MYCQPKDTTARTIDDGLPVTISSRPFEHGCETTLHVVENAPVFRKYSYEDKIRFAFQRAAFYAAAVYYTGREADSDAVKYATNRWPL